MAIGLTRSAVCQRIFGCSSVRARCPPSMKTGSLFLLIFWIAGFAANQSLSLVQSAAAADMSRLTRLLGNALAPLEKDSYDDRREEKLDDLSDSREPNESDQESGSAVDRGSLTPFQRDGSTGVEDVQESHHGIGSDMEEQPLDAFSRGELEGREEPGTQHVEGSYAPLLAEPVSREDTVPGSNPWGGEEGGEKEVETQRPLTAVEEGDRIWLKPEETVVAGRDGSLKKRETHSVSLEEGRKHKSRGTASSLRLSQRGRSRRKRDLKGADNARVSQLRRNRWQNGQRVARALAVLLGIILLWTALSRLRPAPREGQST